MRVVTTSYKARPALRKELGEAPSMAGGVGFGDPAYPGGLGSSSGYRNSELSDLEQRNDPDLFRAYRIATPWAALCVEQRRDEVVNNEFDIVRIDPSLGDGDEEVRLRLLELLHNPDRMGKQTNHSTMIGPAFEDHLVCGRGALVLKWNELDEFIALRPIDGSKLKPNPVWTWEREEAAGPIQVLSNNTYTGVPKWFFIEGNTKIPYGSRDVAVLDYNPVTYKLDGIPPMQALHRFLLAEKDLFRALHTAGKTLQTTGILKVPDPNTGVIEAIEEVWEERIAGAGGMAILGMPAESQYMPVGVQDVKNMGTLDLYDVAVRGVLACFRMPLTAANWTRQLLERSAEEQGEQKDEGLISILRYMERFWNGLIHMYPGTENLELRYLNLPRTTEAESIEAINLKSGPNRRIWTLASLMEAAGEDAPNYPSELKPYYEEIWAIAPEGHLFELPVSYLHKLYVEPKLKALEENPTLSTTTTGVEQLPPGTSGPEGAVPATPARALPAGTQPALPAPAATPAQNAPKSRRHALSTGGRGAEARLKLQRLQQERQIGQDAHAARVLKGARVDPEYEEAFVRAWDGAAELPSFRIIEGAGYHRKADEGTGETGTVEPADDPEAVAAIYMQDLGMFFDSTWREAEEELALNLSGDGVAVAP